MNFQRLAYFIILLSITQTVFSQSFTSQVAQLKRYTPAEIIDPDFGIIRYNKLVPMMGGDSLRYTKDGYNSQSWQEDFYVSGKLLHKGFYLDGAIKIFKNYYENGQIERTFSSSDLKHGKLAELNRNLFFLKNHNPIKQPNELAIKSSQSPLRWLKTVACIISSIPP